MINFNLGGGEKGAVIMSKKSKNYTRKKATSEYTRGKLKEYHLTEFQFVTSFL